MTDPIGSPLLHYLTNIQTYLDMLRTATGIK